MTPIPELSAYLGLNHNGVRRHLGQLVEAGVVEEAVAPPTGRGRPRLTYRLQPSAEARLAATSP